MSIYFSIINGKFVCSQHWTMAINFVATFVLLAKIVGAAWRYLWNQRTQYSQSACSAKENVNYKIKLEGHLVAKKNTKKNKKKKFNVNKIITLFIPTSAQY
jgi:predicted negative regulator of RcsB-dependent stress response